MKKCSVKEIIFYLILVCLFVFITINVCSHKELAFDNYFYNSPLWGNGLSWKGEYAYGDIDGNYKADARLAFVLVEFGIIGLLLFLFYFVKIFNATKRIVPITMKKSLLLVFVYFSIFTFTESGFFDLHCIPYLFIYYFSVKRFYNEHSDCTNVANK